MNEAVAKATRRDLRRAVGEDAVRMVESHEQGLLMHAESLKRQERSIEALRSNLAGAYLRLEEHRDGIDTCRHLIDGLEVLQRLGFWGRLRWLLTGK